MTSPWASWRLKSPTSGLFSQAFIHAHINENIKVPRHWPMWGESIGDRWIPKGWYRGNCIYLMTSSCNEYISLFVCPTLASLHASHNNIKRHTYNWEITYSSYEGLWEKKRCQIHTAIYVVCNKGFCHGNSDHQRKQNKTKNKQTKQKKNHTENEAVPRRL